MAWVRVQLCKLQKGSTRLAAASDKVYQLLVRGRWFSPGTPASSTAKTGRHDIVEILLKVVFSTKKKINPYMYLLEMLWNKRFIQLFIEQENIFKVRFNSHPYWISYINLHLFN